MKKIPTFPEISWGRKWRKREDIKIITKKPSKKTSFVFPWTAVDEFHVNFRRAARGCSLPTHTHVHGCYTLLAPFSEAPEKPQHLSLWWWQCLLMLSFVISSSHNVWEPCFKRAVCDCDGRDKIFSEIEQTHAPVCDKLQWQGCGDSSLWCEMKSQPQCHKDVCSGHLYRAPSERRCGHNVCWALSGSSLHFILLLELARAAQ